MFKIVEFSHFLITEFYQKNKEKYLTFIDATCGKGNDTLFLAETLNHNGTVVAYDIQEEAIDITKRLLLKNHFKNCIFHLSSHEKILEENFDLIIYNLGYLPGSDKTITTTANSTLNSIKLVLSKISNKEDYLIIIVLYPGHENGLIESQIIDDFCYHLPSNFYLVSKYQNYNRLNAPYIITISKNKKSLVNHSKLMIN